MLLAAGQSEEQEDVPTLQILNGVDGPQDIPLKAISDINDNIEIQEDYSVEPDNVVIIERGKNIVLVNSQGTLVKVKAIDSQLKETQLYFADNLVKADLPSGSYILDVVVLTDDGKEYAFVTFLVIVDDGQTLSEINTQNIINAFTSKDIDIRVVFEDDNGDNNTPEEEPSICYFDQTQPECQPDENGDCPNNWPKNDNDQCHPGGSCPEGFGRVDDDETGTCYPQEDITTCEGSNAKVLDPDDCSIYDPVPPVEEEEEEEEPATTESEETVEEIEENEAEESDDDNDEDESEDEDEDEDEDEEDEEE